MGTTSRNPVAYAERTLGVHSVYEELTATKVATDNLRKQYADLVVSRRDLEARLVDREGDIAEELRASNVEYGSQAAYERLLKDAVRQDPKHKEMRASLLEISNELTRAEMELETGRVQERVLTSRVRQIGDLLRFYASGKDAVTVAKVLVSDASGSWPY